MKRLPIFLCLPLALLWGCASVDTKNEWGRLQKLLDGNNEVFWVESQEDQESVCQMVERELTLPLTREKAVSIGLINNKELQSTFEEIGVGKADLVQAGLFKNPSLSALFLFPFSRSGTKIDATALFSLSELWLLPLRRKAAEASLEQTLLHVADKILQTQRDLKIAYSNTFFRKLLLDETQDFYSEMEFLVSESKERRKFGYMTDMDVYNAEVMKSKAQIFLHESQTMLNIEKSKLAQLLGVSSCGFSLADEMQKYEAFDVNLCESLELAYCNRLDLRMACVQISERERLYELSEKMVFKNVQVGPSFERELDGRNTLGPAFDMELPLFDQNQAQIAKAWYLLRMARKQFQALKDEVRMKITINVQEIEHLSFKASTLKGQVLPLQQQIIDFAQEWNGYMQLNRLRVLEAKRELLLQKMSYWEVLCELQNRIYELEYNLGGIEFET